MNWFDRAARYAIKLDPQGLLRWMLPRLSDDWQFQEWLDTQSIPWATAEDRRLDTVAHLKHAEGLEAPWALVVEATTAPDYDLPERLLEYLGRLRFELRHGPENRDKYNVGAVVLQLTGREQPAQLRMRLGKTSVATVLGVGMVAVSTFKAMGVLRRIAAGQVARCVLPFATLMQGGNAVRAVQLWKEIALQEPDMELRRAWGATLKVFAEKSAGQEIWGKALEGWGVEESKFAKEMEARGERRGEQRGEQRATRKGISQTLRIRFGDAIPAEIQRKIQEQTDINVLNRWFEAAIKSASLDEFRAQV